MGILFISHSSRDNEAALRVRDWLKENGWHDIFLDLDPSEGLAPGQRWQEELKRAGENCAAVVVLISPNWLGSVWCRTEFLLADQLGKQVFPVLIAPTDIAELPVELRGKFQLADISTPDRERQGYEALSYGLKRAGLDPQSFDWPPPHDPERSVYRGLQPLEAEDAAIFFGRDAAITRGLDELRRLRDGAPQHMLVILGASGAGKSSFLRAGLISRLARDDRNFLVLRIVRPEQAAISGPQGLNASVGLPSDVSPTSESVVAAFEEARRPIVARLKRAAEAAREEYSSKPPTIVLPVDQAEELFSENNPESADFRRIVSDAIDLDGNAIVLVTIRTDSYEALQNIWMPERQRVFTLPSIVAGSFQQIIEGPARLAKPPIAIEPDLTQQLLAELDTSDALPLLAFALQRLDLNFGASHQIALADYHALGGLEGAIHSATAVILGADPDKEQLARARELFIPELVHVDQQTVKRRVAAVTDDYPGDDLKELADKFVSQRLLRTDGQTIEVAHEAILRQWSPLGSWIAEERESLQTLEGVRAAAREWLDRGRSRAWLTHQAARLRSVRLVTARDRFQKTLDSATREYIAACIRHETQKRERAAATTIVVSMLLAAAFAAGLIFFANSAVQRRQTIADELFKEWRDPEMSRARMLAQQGETAVVEVRRQQALLDDTSVKLSYAQQALETFDRDAASGSVVDGDGGSDDRGELVSSRDALSAEVQELQDNIGKAMSLRNAGQDDDAIVTVALFYAHIYELQASNGVDRQRLADELGVDSRFWAGVERGGASFVQLDSSSHTGAAAWLRERAILGATMVQRDHDEGAPNSVLQALGANQSSWEHQASRF